MTRSLTEVNQILEESLKSALEGSADAVYKFFPAFLDGPLYLPRRYQDKPLTRAPVYPNDLLDILGVQADERVVVPVFTAPSGITAWCGYELKHRQLSGRQLLELIPEQWWICVNPGLQVEKEISPWEIENLKIGDDGIDAIAHEMSALQNSDTLILEEAREPAHLKLQEALKAVARERPQISKLFLAKEKVNDPHGRPNSILIAGALIHSRNPSLIESTALAIQAAAQTAQIGAETVKVYWGPSLDSTMLGVFRGWPPFYEAPAKPSIIQRAWSFLSQKLLRRKHLA